MISENGEIDSGDIRDVRFVHMWGPSSKGNAGHRSLAEKRIILSRLALYKKEKFDASFITCF